MLRLIISHLRKVADKADENLMTVGNLGVCFGPTLLRPKEETMAAIMDIKFCNVVVEVLIGNCHQIFETQPPLSLDLCPPKPSHNMVQISPPATTESSQLIGPNNANNTVSKGTINNNRLRHKQPPQTLTVIYDSPSGKRSETQSAEDLSSTTNSKNSTDSLNSSGSEKSNGLISQKTSPLASSTTNGPNNPLQPKTKSTASYAPLYNPQASET
uniref:Rho-GAP domain-containing protein n=1 Tax=Rhabditophanes sp. KR3021 TaxID=114890 RepID=A0AC35TQW1_9BILA